MHYLQDCARVVFEILGQEPVQQETVAEARLRLGAFFKGEPYDEKILEVFRNLREEFRNDREIFESAFSRNCEVVKYIGSELKKHKETMQKVVEAGNFCMRNADPEFKKDKKFILTVISHTAKDYVVELLGDVEKELRKDEDVIRAAVEKNGEAFRLADVSLRRDPKFVSEMVEIDARAFAYATNEIRENRRDIAVKAVKKNGFMLQYAGAKFQRDKALVKMAIESNYLVFKVVSEVFKNDKDIVEIAIRKNCEAFQYASPEIRKNKEFIRAHICDYCGIFKYVEEEVGKDEDFIKELMSQEGVDLKALLTFVYEDLRKSKAFLTPLLRERESLFELIDPTLKTDRNFVKELVVQNPHLFNQLSPLFKRDKEIVCLALSQSLEVLPQVGEELRRILKPFLSKVHPNFVADFLTRFLAMGKEKIDLMQGLAEKSISFKSIKNNDLKNDKDIVMAALLGGDASVLDYLSLALQKDKELAIFALNVNRANFSRVKKEWGKNFEIAKLAVAKEGTLLSELEKALKENPEIREAAIGSNPRAFSLLGLDRGEQRLFLQEHVLKYPKIFSYADPLILADRDFIKLLAAINPKILAVRPLLRVLRSREFAIELVQQNGNFIQYLPESFKMDRLLALEAVTQSGSAIQYINESLKNRVDLSIAALENDVTAIQFLPASALSIPRVQDLVREYNSTHPESQLSYFSIDTQELKENPFKYLNELGSKIKRGQPLPFVFFENQRGVDGGGLRRDLITSLFQLFFIKNERGYSFLTLDEEKNPMVVSKKEESEGGYYEKIGRILGAAFRTLDEKKFEVKIGDIFSTETFKLIKVFLSYSTDLFLDAKMYAVSLDKTWMLSLAQEKYLAAEEVPLEHLEEAYERYCFWKEEEIVEMPSQEDLKAFWEDPQNRALFKKLLQENACADPKIQAIKALSSGVNSVLTDKQKEEIKIMDPLELKTRIQGKLSFQFLKSKIVYVQSGYYANGESRDQERLKGFLNEWLASKENDRQELERFLYAITGSTTLGERAVTVHIIRHQELIKSATCSHMLLLPAACQTQQEFNEKLNNLILSAYSDYRMSGI